MSQLVAPKISQICKHVEIKVKLVFFTSFTVPAYEYKKAGTLYIYKKHKEDFHSVVDFEPTRCHLINDSEHRAVLYGLKY
jgi:hypothetical protein